MKEPELVFSGLIFLVPAYVAWTGGQILSAIALLLLTTTSTIWHVFHEKWFQPIDFIAMCTVFLLEWINSVRAGIEGIILTLLACIYGLIAFHWGYLDSTFCFNQSYTYQMVYHAWIHVLAAGVITLNLLKLQENEKRHVHSTTLS
jgi:hypothetical protein